MKVLIVAALCLVAVLARPDGEHYTDQWDTIDVEEITSNERLLNNYADCLKSVKSCTKDGQALKDILPEALKTNCAKCTDIQKEKSKTVLKNLATKHQTLFLELEQIFDDKHVYRTQYADRIKAEGVELPPLPA